MNGTDVCPKCSIRMMYHGAGSDKLGRTNCPFRDESDLTPDLVGLEGWRVLATRWAKDEAGDIVGEGETVRFYVGKSTGWKLCHLEIARRDSMGGSPADKSYVLVEKLYERIDRRRVPNPRYAKFGGRGR